MEAIVHVLETNAGQMLETLIQQHGVQLSAYQEGIAAVEQLLTSEDGFYAPDMNGKLTMLLEMLTGELLPELQQLFEDSKDSLQQLFDQLEEEDQQG